MNYFLRTASVIALISSQAFSSNPLTQARDLADAESSQRVLMDRVSNSNYTFDLDEDQTNSFKIKQSTLFICKDYLL